MGYGCPLCGAAEARTRYRVRDRLFRTTKDQFEVVACEKCGALYLWPRPTAEQLARYYPEGYWWRSGSEGGAARRMEGAYRSAVLRDHIRFVTAALGPPPAKLLDLGCGSGDLIAAISRRGYWCAGMDYSLPALKAAQSQGLPAVLADYHDAPFRPGSFDAVSMFHFLEHVADPACAIDFARDALRPGGSLIVQVPNADSLQRAVFGARWSGLDPPRHLIDFRRRDLEQLIEGRGFRIGRRKHFSLRDNPAAAATSLVPALEPVSRLTRLRESVPRRLTLDIVYFGLVLAALPFAVFEAALGRGATIMLEAQKC